MGSLPTAAPAVIAVPRVAAGNGRLARNLTVPHAAENGGLTTSKKGPLIADIPLEYIRRPLLRTRNNDPEKVKQLMESIAEIGLQEPGFPAVIDMKRTRNSVCQQSSAKSAEELARR